MTEFFRVESPCEVISFRLSEIVAISSPNWPKKPAGWCEEYAAEVYLRNRERAICITHEQFAQLKDRLGTNHPTVTKQWENV